MREVCASEREPCCQTSLRLRYGSEWRGLQPQPLWYARSTALLGVEFALERQVLRMYLRVMKSVYVGKRATLSIRCACGTSVTGDD